MAAWFVLGQKIKPAQCDWRVFSGARIVGFLAWLSTKERMLKLYKIIVLTSLQLWLAICL